MPVDQKGEDDEDNEVCVINDTELVTQHILHNDFLKRNQAKIDVCKNWKSGKCYKGEKCNFSHVG